LKDLKPGSPAVLKKLENEEYKTTPPGRFSETKMVAELEKLGIGRPSTFASIVSLIQDRGYVAKKGTQLYPTPLGFTVARVLAAKFPNFTAYEYTAQMEEELDEIADGKQTRIQFLDTFWNGEAGFEKLLETLQKDIDFKELEKYSTIDLYNGFSVRYSRFGTFLQDEKAPLDEKGYKSSVRIDDDADVWDFKDPDVCRDAFTKAKNRVDAKELGILEGGEYKGWTVWARDGKFGSFLQALHPDHVKANAEGKKPKVGTPAPVNHPLPENLDLETVSLKDVVGLFAEVKLPRWSPDKKWLVGLGKRGPYMGRKASAKARPVFRSLPDGHDPKTIDFTLVEELWKAEDTRKTSAEKKPTARKAPAKTRKRRTE